MTPRDRTTPSLLSDLDPALRDRYLASTCTPADLRHIEAWMASDPARRAALMGLRDGLTHIEYPAFTPSSDLAEKVDASIAAASRRQRAARLPMGVPHALGTPASRFGGRALRVFSRPAALLSVSAAALILLVIIGVWLSPSRHSSLASIASQAYQTSAGQRTTIRLADGSTIMLAPATTVSVAADRIHVHGEAYFVVSANPNRPYVIQTATAVVRVLGTRFSVRHYPADRASRVVVEDGKISLRPARAPDAVAAPPNVPPNEPIVLSARTLALVTDSGMTINTGVATQDYLSWTRGMLVFKWVPLRDVVTELMRAYDADIQITDSTLATRKMHMDVSVADQSLPQILELIGQVTDAHYTRQGRTYRLVPGRATTQTPRGNPQDNPSAPPSRHPLPQPEHQYGR